MGNRRPTPPFPKLRVDLADESLWRGSERVDLPPKPWAVLRYLVGHPGPLSSKEALLEAVWPGNFVGDAVLAVAVKQLREALEGWLAPLRETLSHADRPQPSRRSRP